LEHIPGIVGIVEELYEATNCSKLAPSAVAPSAAVGCKLRNCAGFLEVG